jgi:hypothetical protein
VGGERSAEEWEQMFSADLLPHLMPPGQPHAARLPLDVTLLPAGAHPALAGSIGRHTLEDLLILPATAQAYGWVRRRCLYTPLRVLGSGDRAVALWVQALPVPGIRAAVPLGEIAAIARQASGPGRQLLITGRAGRLLVRYDAASDALMDAWVARLRRSVAGDPAPVPAGYPAARGRRRALEAALRLRPDDDIATSGRHGSGMRRTCLLVVTPHELVIVRSAWSANAHRRLTDWLYVPRRAIEHASIGPGSLLLRSAGLELGIELRPKRSAAAASELLARALSDHDRSGTGS